MTNKKTISKDPGIIAAEKALRRAARRALQLGLQTGTPVYVIKNGRIVDLTEQVRRKTTRKNSAGQADSSVFGRLVSVSIAFYRDLRVLFGTHETAYIFRNANDV
jgi:hypothetical protein